MDNLQELKLTYPCHWEYKAILETQHDIKEIVKSVLNEREHSIKKSQNSKKGKYVSYTIKTLVHNDDDRKSVFEELKQHQSIKFVL
ncbi:HP0495 family protein [Sulfurospirillum arcachonense]|uniref:HP0495 family protein n=1 Tax=Sulfurospirillum arcachonense TaxID=57666 RepID=UPI00046881D0|nr:DUF493 domain-containing protein [Sulfurospirillum arcachonense]